MKSSPSLPREPSNRRFATHRSGALIPAAVVAISAAVSALAQSPDYVISRFSGALSANVDGPVATARFDQPASLVFDQDYNLFIADSGSHTIRRISADGIVTTIAGKPGVPGISDGVGSGARFSSPGLLTIDRRGNLYVASLNGKRVQRVTPNGVVTTIADEPALFKDSSLSSIAVDSADNLYLCFSWPEVVRKRTPGGVITTYAGTNHSPAEIGTAYSDKLWQPTAIVVDSTDVLYVSDNVKLAKIPAVGTPSLLIPQRTPFFLAPALAIDGAGTIFVADSTRSLIAKVTQAGAVSTLAGILYSSGYVDGNVADAKFSYPVGVAVDSTGHVFVADKGVDVIRQIAPEGLVSTCAGNPARCADGSSEQALFQDLLSVASIVADGQGNLFVAELSGTVRKVDVTGAVVTIAGNPVELGNVDGAGAIARFGILKGIAIDGSGNLYVSDATAKTIRKITPDHVVSTLAGSGASTPVDGLGTAASFDSPGKLTVDSAGNIYVADYCAIRKITPDRAVITIAGTLGTGGSGYQDGPAAQAKFRPIKGLAVNEAGALFASGSFAIRKIAAGAVSTLAGVDEQYGDVDGPGAAARFSGTGDLVIDHNGDLYMHTASGVKKIAPDATVSTVLASTELGTQAGVTVDASQNIYLAGPKNAIWKIAPPKAPPIFTAKPQSRSGASGANIILSAVATGSPTPRWQWCQNGEPIAGAIISTLTLQNLQPINTGLYTAVATSDDASTTSDFAIVGIASTHKVLGGGIELQPANIRHPNGNVFDQVLLTGTAESITSDSTLGQVTRTSFIDLQDDIVQVEFSGPGTLSLVLENSTEPAPPANYNQPTVSYMKGHAGIVIVGANETTNVSVFSVGRATAFDSTGHYNILAAPGPTNDPATNGSSLFVGHADTAYDGIADIAFIAISSTNGKFGGVRTSNARYSASHGITGIYAPGVTFQGPVFVGNLTAFAEASAALVLGSASDVRITGGNMLQANAQPVRVKGISQLKFTAGSDSRGTLLPAQTNRATYQEDGVDVTNLIVVGPTL